MKFKDWKMKRESGYQEGCMQNLRKKTRYILLNMVSFQFKITQTFGARFNFDLAFSLGLYVPQIIY